MMAVSTRLKGSETRTGARIYLLRPNGALVNSRGRSAASPREPRVENDMQPRRGGRPDDDVRPFGAKREGHQGQVLSMNGPPGPTHLSPTGSATTPAAAIPA